MWSIRLRGPCGKQVVLQVDPEAKANTFTVVAVLWAHESVFCRIGIERIGIEGDRFSYIGFPPQKIEVNSSTLIKCIFEPNDTVVVDSSSRVSATVGTAGAHAAAKTSARSKPAATKKPSIKSLKGGVHMLNSPICSNKKAPPKRKISGRGQQLGSLIEANSAISEDVLNGNEVLHKSRRRKALNLTSKEDVAISLVNAVSEQTHERAAKFFRAAAKNAVVHQYELTLATARLNAALGHNFETEELLTARRADGSAAKLLVRFKETPRKWKEEIVDLLRTKELQAVLKYVLLSGGETGREMLKPFNMAQVSTRVFWSIAHMYNGDVAAGLAYLVPEVDWAFIDTRTRTMSEKAMEAKANEEEYKSWKQRKHGKTNGDPTLLADVESPPETKLAISDVTSADMNEEIDVGRESSSPKREESVSTPALSATRATPSSLRSAAANAALIRLDRSAQTKAVISAFLKDNKLTQKSVPNEGDTDEVSEDEIEDATTVYCDACKKARILSSEEAENADLDKDPWTCINLRKAGRSGGCGSTDDEVAQITGAAAAKWLQTAGITTRRELADASVNATVHFLLNPLDPSVRMVQERLNKLIDEARLDEVNDWMADIISEADILQRLELQKLGTPADLIATPTDLILAAVGFRSDISIELVRTWQNCAKSLVSKHSWLTEWRTL
ncbi:uncharacterized protein CCR75_006634 [Bremia lactucae]|uniref:CW-type domain-containing protein n=1 Tax=Bremia lactucae TaxID=4779 RepID=A0A976FE54_BRELC|nr:hypothetical protein CCR75_006634 [Bremia lactucae]